MSAAMSVRATASRSTLGSSSSAWVALTPFTKSMTSTRFVLRSGYTVGDADAVDGGEDVGETARVVGLGRVVELLEHPVGELRDDVGQVRTAGPPRSASRRRPRARA